MDKLKRPLLGAHVSAGGGLVKAIDNGEKIGAECIQIFGASPRSYFASVPTKEVAEQFKERLKASSIKSVYQHGAYLPNLGTADAEAMRKSIVNLSTHLQISNAIGGQGVIFHVGSPKKGDRNQALKRAVVAMKQILKSVRGDAQLIMENSGSVKKIGGSIEDLQYLFTQVNDSRLKVCVDTAHSFEAGLIEDYTPVKIKKFLDDWDEAIGLNNIPALHINDSKTQYNSQNDKHENLGEGYIGLSGFKNLAKEKRLAHTSWFLEVPGFPAEGGSASGGAGPDKKNMELLKSCFSK